MYPKSVPLATGKIQKAKRPEPRCRHPEMDRHVERASLTIGWSGAELRGEGLFPFFQDFLVVEAESRGGTRARNPDGDGAAGAIFL